MPLHVRPLAACLSAACLAAPFAAAQQPAAAAPPPKHAMTIADLLAVKGVSDPQISPDGQSVLYAMSAVDLAANVRRGGTWMVSAAGGAPRPWPDSATRAAEARWSPDGKRIAYVAAGQLWVADASGGARTSLAHLAGGAHGPVWSPAGDRIAFMSAVTPACDDDACDAERARARANDPVKAHVADSLLYRHWDAWDDGTRVHLFVVGLDGGAPRDVTPHAPYDVPPGPFYSSDGYAFSPDGQEIAFTAIDAGRAAAWSTDLNVYVAPVAGGAATAITAANTGADADPVYSPDGRWIAYRSQARAGFESDRWRLMLYDRKGKSARELLPRWDRNADRYAFTPDGKAMIVQAVDAARTKLWRVTLADAPEGAAAGAPLPLVSERNNTQLSMDRAGHTIAWMRDAIDRPPEVLVAVLGAGGISDVHAATHANDSLLAAVRLQPAEDFWFRSVKGDSVQGMLVRPPMWAPGAQYPVVLLVHGGPQTPWLDAWSARWNAELFASPGYGVVLVNPRGSTGYGQRFTDQVSGDWGGAAYADLMNGFDAALARWNWLDGNRAVAAGGSYGGYMVNWIAGHNDRFRALVSHAGVYDLEAMYGATDELWFTDWEFTAPYWDPLAMATQYRTWSPHLYAARFKTPMLVIAGQRDYRVPYTESLSLFTALQRQGIPSRLIVFDEEGHWILKPADQRFWWTEVLGWIRRWVGPSGAP
ncbi:MAG TPA: S9 family peptidase [Gemmatimonadaceae bacterium]|nr:S9 family peptidase [Gemmatimonadaceae bacterium]